MFNRALWISIAKNTSKRVTSGVLFLDLLRIKMMVNIANKYYHNLFSIKYNFLFFLCFLFLFLFGEWGEGGVDCEPSFIRWTKKCLRMKVTDDDEKKLQLPALAFFVESITSFLLSCYKFFQ